MLGLCILRCDGTPADCGHDADGVFFAWLAQPNFVVQLMVETSDDHRMHAVCRNLGGDQLASWSVPDMSRHVQRCIEEVLKPGSRRLGVVLADGRLMSPQSTWRDL